MTDNEQPDHHWYQRQVYQGNDEKRRSIICDDCDIESLVSHDIGPMKFEILDNLSSSCKEYQKKE